MNLPFLRWLVGIAIALVALHLFLFHLWGRGQVLFILPWYAVMMDSIPVLAALGIAFIAFGRYRVLREPLYFWSGIALLLFALFALFDSLTAPNILSGGRGILGRSSGTSSWFWHLMFSSLSFFCIVAVLARWPRAGPFARRWWWTVIVAGILGGVALSVLLIVFEEHLPLLIVNGEYTSLNREWEYVILAGFAVGLVLSVWGHQRTRDPCCAHLAVAQLLLIFVIVTDLVGERIYDVWWYWHRVLLVAAFAVVLFGHLSEYARLFRRERERTHELEALQGLTDVLAHQLELPVLARAIVDKSLDALRVDAAAIWVADRGRRELSLLALRGFSPAFAEASRCLSYDSPRLAGLVARTEHFEDVADVSAGLVALDSEIYLREGLRSLFGVPLCARGHLVGVMCYANRRPRHFAADKLAFITPATGLFAVTIENSQLYDDLRQALRLREEFMAAVAHELRTPVTVIQGRAQLTLKVDARETEARLALERILNASGRITHLIEDLVAVLRVRPGGTTLDPQCFDLSVLVKTLLEQIAQTTEHYTFQSTVSSPLPVFADRALIGEVLNRLIENAMRYASEGGSIEVVARRMAGEAVVEVTDHGIGIPIERQPHVFEPFYELIPPGEPGYVGLVSLGLYLSKQIVEAYGGRIWFASTPAKGATFSFTVPLAATCPT